MINNKVALVEPDRNALLKTDLQSSIAKLEEVWEGHRDAGDIEKNMGILIIFKKRNGDDVDMSLYIYIHIPLIFHQWRFIRLLIHQCVHADVVSRCCFQLVACPGMLCPGEVSTLKHELWQTIQAHNHNAEPWL